MSEKMFSVMKTFGKEEPKNVTKVPWSFVGAHEKQAMTNHFQTLTRLNERGGLSVVELWHVVNDQDWRGPLNCGARITYPDACKWLANEMAPTT